MHFSDDLEIYKFSKRYSLDKDFIGKLIKEEVSLVNPHQKGGLSRLGGRPMVPKDFELPSGYLFFAQFNLSELSNFYPSQITGSNFPKSGLLSVFIKSHENEFYEDDFLREPGVKLFYFDDVDKLNSSKAYIDDTIEFKEQSISFEKSYSLPEMGTNPEFEITDDLNDLYDMFEYDMAMKLDKGGVSNFFGWSTNCQYIYLDDYTKIQDFYQTKSKIVHLFTITNDFDLNIKEVVFETISVFILEEDLINGVFDRVWMIPCFD